MTDELTQLQQAEREAMTGDREAILTVISALRRYRALGKRLLDSRYSDGECDGYSIHRFECEMQDIEEGRP